MDIEQLNKSQTVLLTLLVSFVTSIATGIVTVALMEQGVTPVTQTINRVVERTKEVVVTQPQVVTEEKTVVVRESDSIAGAIRKNTQSVVAIYAVTTPASAGEVGSGDAVTQTASAVVAIDGAATTSVEVAQTTSPAANEVATFVGRGVVLRAGVVATDASLLNSASKYKVALSDGSASYGQMTHSANGIGVITLEKALGVSASIRSTAVAPESTVAVLSGAGKTRPLTAVVVDVTTLDSGMQVIDVGTSDVTVGSVLIDTSGNVIGFSSSAVRTQKGSSWFDAGVLQTISL